MNRRSANGATRYLRQDGTFSDGRDLSVNQKGSKTGIEKKDLETIMKLGEGGFGEVQLVRHKRGQLFAEKIVPLDFAQQEVIIRELSINESLNCPYVVKCYDLLYANNRFSILLEYMDCGTLADLVREVGEIPERYLAAMCKQLLEGLVYLHYTKHIIHRDLKPSNLLINQKGHIKIGDFGVSAIVESTYGIATAGSGTKYYVAPERISEGTQYIRGDIWSLGLIMLEVATGSYPYNNPDQSTDEYALLETIAEDPAPFASPDKFSKEFCSFISSCLRKDPKKRLSARNLLKHPFVKKYDKKQVNLSSYFKKTLHSF